MSSNPYGFTIGHDGEVFLKGSNGNYVSAIGKIGGSKKDPLPIPHLPKGYALQEDNVAVEFNIPPAISSADFVSSISAALGEIKRRAFDMKLSVAINASAEFPMEELGCPEAWMMGCDPDYDAWSGKMNPPPEVGHSTLRSCGGHVHIGNIRDMPPFLLARACDVFLGVPLSIYDMDVRRQKLYGRPGAFRATPYGMEYRTLSNFWLASPQLISYVFKGAVRAATDALRWFERNQSSPEYMSDVSLMTQSVLKDRQSRDFEMHRRVVMASRGISEPGI